MVKQIQQLQFRPQIPELPVIGIVTEHDVDDALPGLRSLRDEITKDSASSNAPYLVAVWDELVHARQPIAVCRTFIVDSKPVKVDVVAENGSRWIRVNTIKYTRLAMEMTSYLSSDDDDDCEDQLDNSVLRMGTALLAAAKANPVPVPSASTSTTTTIIPRITLRLTRLDPLANDARSDAYIAQTIHRLRDMGVDVELGERPQHSAPSLPGTPAPARVLRPTTDVNLDLSALIALVSDISHAPLPHNEQEAYARFVPPQSYLDWKRERTRELARGRQTDDNQHQHRHKCTEKDEDTQTNYSRALTAQTIQEMHRGILDEIRDRTALSPGDDSDFDLTNGGVRFWTTHEARRRCLQIVAKIGGDRERQRADALLGSTRCARALAPSVPVPVSTDGGNIASATQGGTNASPAQVEAYWRHSRYPVGFLPLLVPVRIYPSTLSPSASGDEQPNRSRRTTFGNALVRTCTQILQGENAPVSAPIAVEEPMLEENDEEKEDGDVPPAARTSIPKLTVHTVASMLAGASRGHTTLTTNRSSVRAVLRAMHGGNAYLSSYTYQYEHEGSTERAAAMWVLDPRSLAEGMRSDTL